MEPLDRWESRSWMKSPTYSQIKNNFLPDWVVYYHKKCTVQFRYNGRIISVRLLLLFDEVINVKIIFIAPINLPLAFYNYNLHLYELKLRYFRTIFQNNCWKDLGFGWIAKNINITWIKRIFNSMKCELLEMRWTFFH